jgi:hypothetical protein
MCRIDGSDDVPADDSKYPVGRLAVLNLKRVPDGQEPRTDTSQAILLHWRGWLIPRHS